MWWHTRVIAALEKRRQEYQNAIQLRGSSGPTRSYVRPCLKVRSQKGTLKNQYKLRTRGCVPSICLTLGEGAAILGLGGVDMWPISYFTGAIFSIFLLNLLYVHLAVSRFKHAHNIDEGSPRQWDHWSAFY